MAVLRPDQFDQVVEQTRRVIDGRLASLRKEYREAYEASHRGIVREGAGHVASGPSDPTAQITGDPLDKLRPGLQASIRRTLESAPKRLAEADSLVASIEPRIASAMDRLDPRERPEPLRYPRTASATDLAESKAAQQRRILRGENT